MVAKKNGKISYLNTRAINDIHKDILKLVGADYIILPEKEIGIRLADNLSSPFTDLIRLTKDFWISQIIAPKDFIGEKVIDLDLFQSYNIRCIGRREEEKIIAIDPMYIIAENDKLIFAGTNKDLEAVAKL